MKHLYTKIILCLSLMILLTSCSTGVGLLSEKNSWLPYEIKGTMDFLKVFLIVQVSIIIAGAILGIFLSKLGQLLSVLAHFVWIVLFRDYGFFTVFFLFIAPVIINFVYGTIKQKTDNFK